jgi:hypothetical protein
MKVIQKDTISHYNRMMKYGKNYFKKYSVWSQRLFSDRMKKGCTLCPLILHSKKPNDCCNGLWVKLNDAKTLPDWLFFLQEIKNFVKKYG